MTDKGKATMKHIIFRFLPLNPYEVMLRCVGKTFLTFCACPFKVKFLQYSVTHPLFQPVISNTETGEAKHWHECKQATLAMLLASSLCCCLPAVMAGDCCWILCIDLDTALNY